MLIIIISIMVIFLTQNASALTTEEMINLKKAGVSEDSIVWMVEHGYKDADKVLKLKKADFKDENIQAIIKSEAGHQSAKGISETRNDSFSAQADLKTPARIKIIWYRIFHDKPLLQNKETIDNARIAIAGKTLQITWPKREGMNPLNAFQKEPFESPFYWELNKNDILETGEEGYNYKLQTDLSHKGKPDMDDVHYWVIYLDPENSKLIEHIKQALGNK